MISRRAFVMLTAGVVAASRISWGVDQVPDSLDHILLGCNDLQRGIDFVARGTGVKAVFGGVHPGRGTQNALLSLGKMRYLEIIAPDPQQAEVKQFEVIKTLTKPAVIGWAAHVSDIDALGARLKSEGISVDGPSPGSRVRPDGKLLKWKAMGIGTARTGLVPFFIEWSKDSPHPSTDAPAGCRLTNFFAATPRQAELQDEFEKLKLNVKVVRSEKPTLHATIRGSKGSLNLEG